MAGCLCALHRQMDDGHSLNRTPLPIMGDGIVFPLSRLLFCSGFVLDLLVGLHYCVAKVYFGISASDRSWIRD